MKALTGSYVADLKSGIIIKELTPDTANNLIEAGFPFGSNELYQPLVNKFLQVTKFVPYTTRLVAYHVKKKRAVGFLCIVKDNALLYSIKFVFTDPRFRKLGIASRMLNFALLLAKQKGAKKVYLDVEHTNIAVINLYQKLGFQILGTRLVGQGYLTNFPRLRVITRTFLGQGYFTKFIHKEKGHLIPLQEGSNSNKKLLFNVYQSCMDKKLIDFFELDANNIMNGYTQYYQPFFLRDVFINELGNSYALIFNRPFFSNAVVEVGSVSEGSMPSMMEDLFKILHRRGMAYLHVTMFNINDAKSLDWFKEKEFKSFNFLIMGRSV